VVLQQQCNIATLKKLIFDNNNNNNNNSQELFCSVESFSAGATLQRSLVT